MGAPLTLRPIERLLPGDRVLSQEGRCHAVVRVDTRPFCGLMTAATTDAAALWLTATHRVWTRPRPRSLGGERDWSATPISHLTRRQQLRREATAAEQRLWSRLRGRQLDARFRRQHPVGPFIADFYSRDAHLVIEVDGDTHADDDAVEYDAARTRYLQRLGLDVLRFTNEEVRTDLVTVLGVIWEYCAALRQTAAGAEWTQAGRLVPGDVLFATPELVPVEVRAVEHAPAREPVVVVDVEGAASIVTEAGCVGSRG